MSHSVTVTRTTTTTTTSALLLNTGYMKTYPGLLKIAQLVLGIVIVALLAHYMYDRGLKSQQAELFALLMATTFMIGTFCILLSCFVSISTGSIISKTIYEVIYHSVACVLSLIAGLVMIIIIHERNYPRYNYNPYLAASILLLVNAVLYLLSAFLAGKTYRGI